MSVLVTGGAGYIGSHTVIELLNNNIEAVVLDNFSNANKVVLERMEKITGKKIKCYETDVRDTQGLRAVFEKENIDAVIHFAGLKAVGESVEIPLDYYDNNLGGTVKLLQVMKEFNVKNMIFSSSATVYGNDNEIPFTEGMATSAINPYGYTKVVIERILADLYVSDHQWNVICLRYFNPIGAHKSGLIGEDPNGVPNNLLPYIAQVAVGRLEKLFVFGDDYDTVDGTGVRDYIHVLDLARGHVKALNKLSEAPGYYECNLGTGKGVSVLELVSAFEAASGVKIPYEITARRAGDIAACYADVEKAQRELGFTAEYNVHDMCADSWRWQKQNPMGYES